MPITCPKCRTTYQVPDSQIGDKGRRVKCIKCEHVWHAQLDVVPAMVEAEANMATPASQPTAQKTAGPTAAAVQTSASSGFASADRENNGPERVDGAPSMETPLPEEDQAANPLSQIDDDRPVDESAVAMGDAGLQPAVTDGLDQDAIHDGLSDESADIIANVSQAMIEIENRDAAAPGAVKAPVVKTQAKVKKRSGLVENIGGIAAVAAAALMLFGAVAFREPIVRAVPETAKLYGMVGMQVNLRGLEFTNVGTSSDFENGVPVLMVSGTIVNVSNEPVALPVVRLALRTARGQEVYAWSYEPSVKRLAASEQVDFTTRVASPPDGASDIQLRFIGIDRVTSNGGG